MNTEKLAEEIAAENMDWTQVALNGGPPCFHLCGDGHFCGRAERWAGHGPGGFPSHQFVSLEDLLRNTRAACEGEKAEASPDANVEAMRAMLLERSKVGLKKYGVTTERKDLSAIDWLIHLQQELADALVYAEAMKQSDLTLAMADKCKAEAFDWSPFKPPFKFVKQFSLLVDDDDKCVCEVRGRDNATANRIGQHLAALMNEGSELKALRERLDRLADQWEADEHHIRAMELREAMK